MLTAAGWHDDDEWDDDSPAQDAQCAYCDRPCFPGERTCGHPNCVAQAIEAEVVFGRRLEFVSTDTDGQPFIWSVSGVHGDLPQETLDALHELAQRAHEAAKRGELT